MEEQAKYLSIDPEARALIEEEEKNLAQVFESLKKQFSQQSVRFGIEADRAQELTSEYITARTEDKHQLASNEALSHRLVGLHKSEVKNLETLLKKPYFARVVLEEQVETGTRKIEYMLGLVGNADSRIVDWRKAPRAKLYYEYQEGDEYLELIQGEEREGRILARRKVDIEEGRLIGLSCHLGHFVFEEGAWKKVTEARRRVGSKNRLPNVLSLITPEQFRAITENADSAVLIQGVAGSGKTTVALHRLSWLLQQDSAELRAKDCAVIARSNALRAYVETSLPHAGVEDVSVFKLFDLKTELISKLFNISKEDVRRPSERTSFGAWRLKNSLAMLKAIEHYFKNGSVSKGLDYRQQLLEIFEQPQTILDFDESKLLDRDLIKQVATRYRQSLEEGVFDPSDDALLLLLFQVQTGLAFPSSFRAVPYEQIVVDEVQDYSPVELAFVVNCAKDIQSLTLAGDSAQDTRGHSQFVGWTKLLEHWGFDKSEAQFVTLSVSHRSTLPIMKLADHVQNKKGSAQTSRGRIGKAPRYFQCVNDNFGFTQVKKWLEAIIETYPHDTAVIVCRDSREAQYALSLVKPSFGELARIGDDSEFSFEQGIVITDVAQVKGLEFPHVLIWNPSEERYVDDAISRNRLYVAITRAEENLCLVTWEKPSPVLPHIYSKLVRGCRVPEDFEQN
jgi:DNA helicase II / ATP-dependent DNA helicase PcrA